MCLIAACRACGRSYQVSSLRTQPAKLRASIFALLPLVRTYAIIIRRNIAWWIAPWKAPACTAGHGVSQRPSPEAGSLRAAKEWPSSFLVCHANSVYCIFLCKFLTITRADKRRGGPLFNDIAGNYRQQILWLTPDDRLKMASGRSSPNRHP